ncbi:helix-turn-helix domain-containing protein [Niabella sp. W65]|nr:helix-turn-helix domain-containing protein [Niabella sp. W65]MCH7363463.1 helix-turn-helix domain-containing protein [Niabella sp. W65]
MLTARTSDEAQYEGYEAGADAYLVKPFDMDMLKLRIRKLMQMFLDRQKLFSTGKEVKSDTITTNPLDKDLLERAMNCVNRNLDNTEYTVEKFSAEMHMDRTGLYRKLMALTGQSPRDFIRTIRLNRAAELLSRPNAIVSQVAEEVGFNSVSYFSKSFQEKFGVSPSQYGQ